MSTFKISLSFSPSKWFEKADSLWHCAEVLQKSGTQTRELHRAAIDKMWEDREAKVSEELNAINELEVGRLAVESESVFVAAMLRAMSIEAELKGAYYAREIESLGHISKVKRCPFQHKLVSLSENLGLEISEESKRTLEVLETMFQLGRYPITTQNAINSCSQPTYDTKVMEVIRSFTQQYKVKASQA